MNLSQFMALVRLRFQLTLNQIKKGGTANSILFTIISILIIVFVLLSFVTALVLGVVLLRSESISLLLTWNLTVFGFLFMWGFHVLNRIQQNDAISIDKLLHLPITFHGAFLLNYLSSFANLTLASIAPLMLGLAIAMPIAKGWPSFVAIPLTVSFLFMVTAITHQLRSWLAEKMQNKRTRGILMAVLPLAFVGLFVGILEVTDSKSITGMLRDVPMGWLPSGIVAAETGNWLPGVLGSLAMTAIGCAGLFFSYRSSMRKFTGASSVVSKSSGNQNQARQVWPESKMFAKLPGVSEPVAGIAMGTMRSIQRAPEVFAALVPVIVLAIFGTPYLIGMEGYVIPNWIVDVLPLGLIAVALLGFPAFLFSSFSYDRDGFRAYILSPVQRRDILLGKNIAIGIPTVVLGWLTMIIAQLFVPVGALWFLGSLIALPASLMLLFIIGNIVTVFFAIGLKRGSMSPVNAKVIPVIALYIGILVGPFAALLPTWLAVLASQLVERFSGYPMGVLYLLLSSISLYVSWLVYRKSLDEIGGWLWQKETSILEVVANVPE